MAAQAVNAAAPGGAAVGASLYVAGLDANVTDSQLYSLFSQIGEVVSVEVCQDLSIELSLRYGYVHYRNPQCAQRALEELNFTPLNGKPIRVMCFHQESSASKMGHGSDADFTEKGMKEHNGIFKGKQVSMEPSLSEENIELFKDKANFTNVFVKNFCESTTEDDLKKKLGQFGLITSAVVMKNKGGTSKCCGLVNFANAEDAARTVESLNGQIFGEKKWYVGRAQSKYERQLELKGHLECVKYAFDNGSNLYVKNLDRSIDDEKLKEMFSSFGSVTTCKVLRDEKGNSIKRAFVSFSSAEEASDALSGMNGKVLAGKPLYVAIAQRKEDKRASLQNLGKEIEHEALPETFSSSGDILSCKVAKDASGHSKGCSFVQFAGEVTGQETIGELDSIIGKFNGVIMKLNDNFGELIGIVRELNGNFGELNGIVREFKGLLLNEKQVNTEQHSLTKERELLVDKANLTIVSVKNFYESTTEEDLKKIFGEFGSVIDTVVMRNEDGTSKCFGFVNFKRAEDAARAVESLNGQRFDKKKWYSGRSQKILERELELENSFEQVVKEAVDKQSKLYVKNLNDSIDDEKLKELFSSFGRVTSCKILKDRKGRSEGSGFIAFSSHEEASRALCELNGRILLGKPLKIALAQRKEDSKAQLQNLDMENDHKALPETFLSSVNPGSCKVATDASGRSMGSGSVHSSEESLQEANGEHNGMLLDGKQVHAESSPNEKERRLSLDNPYFTNNVFIKNFCKSTTEDDLKKIFGEFGLVTSTVIMRNEGKTSKCFGYVNFENAEDAARAVESLNGQIFNKKRWYVEIKRKSFKKEPRPNYQFESCVNEEVDKGSNLSVENHSIPSGKLSELFSPSRSLKSFEVMQDRNGISSGSGFVALSPSEQASKSLSVKKVQFSSSKPLHVAQAQRKEDRRVWFQGQPGFGYEELRAPGVRPARPLMHSMSVPLIQTQQRDLHSGGRRTCDGPMQKDLRPALATKQQMVPRGHEMGGRLVLCDAVKSHSIPVGALASWLANASSLNRGRQMLDEILYPRIEQLLPEQLRRRACFLRWNH